MNLDLIENIIKLSSQTKHSTTDLLVAYYQAEGCNLMQASVKAENNCRQFVELIQDLIINNEKSNCYCLFKQVTPNITEVQLDYYKVKKILNQLNNLHWEEFEDFCSIMVQKCFKVVNVTVTQSTNDGGVDFEGILNINSNWSKVPFGKVEIYGQAKCYSGSVNRIDIDKFTAFANRKKRDHQYPAQLFLFCTTSDYVASALEEIRKNNFVGLNGMQLATLVYNYLISVNYSGEDFIRSFMA